MGLTGRERQSLTLIEDRLTQSDRRLASLLGMFARLAASEALPVRERIPVSRLGRLACSPLAVPLLWLAVSLGLIAMALAVGHGAAAS